MNRVALAIAVLAAVGPIARAHQAPPPPPPPGQPTPQATRDRARPTTGTAVIRGRVLAADTDTPIRRARVSWSSDAPSAERGQPPSVLTDRFGRFEIASLPAGSYRVSAYRSGYLTVGFGARRGRSGTGTSPTLAERELTIDLADGQAFENAELRLSRAAAIAGRVIDEFGDPMIAALVWVSRLQSTNGRRRLVPVGTDFTDDQGDYRVAGLPPASYFVSVIPPSGLSSGGTAYPQTFYPGVLTRDQAQPVTLREGQQANEIDVMLSPIRIAGIKGTIVTSRGTAPRAASLTVRRVVDTGVSMEVYGTSVRSSGEFTVSSVPPGECDLIASVQTERLDTEYGVLHLFVGNDDMEGLSIVTGSEGRIMGSVRTDTGGTLPVPGSPAMNLPMQSAAAFTVAPRVVANAVEDGSDGVLGSTATGQARPATVSPLGGFSAAVRPGRRVVDLTGLPDGWGLVSVMAGERNVTDLPIDATPGTTLTLQIVVSNKLPEISGTAVDQADKAVADYDVVVFPRDPARWLPGSAEIRTERPNQRGRFRVIGLRPGDYYVAAVHDDDETDWFDPETLYRLRDASVRVTVGLGEKKAVRLPVRETQK